MTTTLYGILLSATGLSHREAAALHGVKQDTVKSWSTGRNPANDGVIGGLAKIVENIQYAVDEISAKAREAEREESVIVLEIAGDNLEAKELGWPTASVQSRSVAMVAVQALKLGAKVRIDSG